MNKEMVLSYIDQVTDPGEVDMLMDAIFRKKRQLYPGWEILYVALHKGDPLERERTVRVLLETI